MSVMQIDDMTLVSIDDHVIEPADMFENHMPSRFRGEAPKYVRGGPDGVDHWEYQGVQTGSVGLNAVASWPSTPTWWCGWAMWALCFHRKKKHSSVLCARESLPNHGRPHIGSVADGRVSTAIALALIRT